MMTTSTMRVPDSAGTARAACRRVDDRMRELGKVAQNVAPAQAGAQFARTPSALKTWVPARGAPSPGTTPVYTAVTQGFAGLKCFAIPAQHAW
jgi:hypothetical protein